MFRASVGNLSRGLTKANSHRPCSTLVNAPNSLQSEYDTIIVGGGHNGLVAAAYLAKAGQSVAVLERRHVIGGAAVTEELVPGFKFSRASYVLSLLRPQIIRDLELKRHGLKYHLRGANSYVPLRNPDKNGATSLLLGAGDEMDVKEIAKFSSKDAEIWPQYHHVLEDISTALEPLLDTPPVDLSALFSGRLSEAREQWPAVKVLLKACRGIGKHMGDFYDIMTAPVEKFLERWFESELLRSALSLTAIIGMHHSPRTPGSGYTLLHHYLGGLDDQPASWGYVVGGMGAVSRSIASAAREGGASIFIDREVKEIMIDNNGGTMGVLLNDGTEVRSKRVLSNATADVTFRKLLPNHQHILPDEFRRDISSFDYSSSVMKINVAISRLPNFLANPSTKGEIWHQATILLNTETVQDQHDAFLEAEKGICSTLPTIRMTIPSVLDKTVAPPGAHVVQLFVQYMPFHLADGVWDGDTRTAITNRVFDSVETYCPGFKSSIVGYDSLCPPDLEEVFGLTGGNIFHGSLSLDQIYFGRPTTTMNNYRSPIPGLYLCGSSAHPGGGVMGSPGRLCAMKVLRDLK